QKQIAGNSFANRRAHTLARVLRRTIASGRVVWLRATLGEWFSPHIIVRRNEAADGFRSTCKDVPVARLIASALRRYFLGLDLGWSACSLTASFARDSIGLFFSSYREYRFNAEISGCASAGGF